MLKRTYFKSVEAKEAVVLKPFLPPKAIQKKKVEAIKIKIKMTDVIKVF